ncbi:MAG: 5'-methylthioadenosine/adenosylhomocysteine nucleosidase [Clostridiales bacterium]|jgi:adenosylhomocysteine nucleosidase|nr:5'-methylthioadenosine/adenosylhomocysteine nucleosidase [Clostridiales bacterium]
MKTIGIIGAMEEEISQIRSRMELVQAKNIVGADYYIGKMRGQSVIAARSGVGKVNSAICAQVLIDLYAIDYLVNVGVAGAVNRELNIGDVVVSKDAVHHDFDASVFGDPIGFIPRLDITYFPADPELIRAAEESGRAALDDEFCEAKLTPKVVVGRIATGDVFVSGEDRRQRIWQLFRADCVEMEGAAIAQTCYLNRIPFVVVRTISDRSGAGADAEFREFIGRAGAVAANVIERMVERIQ